MGCLLWEFSWKLTTVLMIFSSLVHCNIISGWCLNLSVPGWGVDQSNRMPLAGWSGPPGCQLRIWGNTSHTQSVPQLTPTHGAWYLWLPRPGNAEMEFLSFWWNFRHWLLWKQCSQRWKFCQNDTFISMSVLSGCHHLNFSDVESAISWNE